MVCAFLVCLNVLVLSFRAFCNQISPLCFVLRSMSLISRVVSESFFVSFFV